ncbi:MAG: hypothetical protein SV862_00050 [Pseudomonadota bacterium]|nr:hypothetical protein [Pseudomonadota bacterium]
MTIKEAIFTSLGLIAVVILLGCWGGNCWPDRSEQRSSMSR